MKAKSAAALQASKITAESLAIFDWDGVMSHSVTRYFDKAFPGTEGRAFWNAVKETVFLISHAVPSAHSHLDRSERKPDAEAVAYMKRCSDLGYRVLVRTTNRSIDKSVARAHLRGRHGIDLEIEDSRHTGKTDGINAKRMLLVDDSPIAAAAALLKSRSAEDRVYLLRREYNGASGTLLNAVADSRKFVYGNWQDFYM